MAPSRLEDGGWAREVTIRELGALKEPGGMREIHWHPDADEIQYYLGGKARMTVFD